MIDYDTAFLLVAILLVVWRIPSEDALRHLVQDGIKGVVVDAINESRAATRADLEAISTKVDRNLANHEHLHSRLTSVEDRLAFAEKQFVQTLIPQAKA